MEEKNVSSSDKIVKSMYLIYECKCYNYKLFSTSRSVIDKSATLVAARRLSIFSMRNVAVETETRCRQIYVVIIIATVISS